MSLVMTPNGPIHPSWKLFETGQPSPSVRQTILRWVTMLESGNFLQGHARLATFRQDTTEYCCLGLSILAMDRKFVCGENLRAKVFGTTSVTHGLSENLCTELHLWDQFGRFGDGSDQSLVGLNDTWRWSFRDIAQFIRRMYRHQYGEDLC